MAAITKGRPRALPALLLALFFLGLAGLLLPRILHEVPGLAFFALVLWHALAFFRSKKKAPLKTALITLFLASSLLLLLVSGVALTGWLGEAGDFNWRSAHLLAAGAALLALFGHVLQMSGLLRRSRAAYAAGAGTFMLAAAAVFGLPYLDRWFNTVEVNQAELLAGDKAPLPGRVLTVYFTWPENAPVPPGADAVSGASLMRDGRELIGNSRMIALIAQSIAGGSLSSIRVEEAYSAQYGKTTARARKELEAGALPVLREGTEDPGAFDTVILVYPLWWGTVPRPVASWLTAHSFAGRRIVPIVTHGGSGAGESLKALGRLAPGARVTEPLALYSSDIRYSRARILKHLKGLD